MPVIEDAAQAFGAAGVGRTGVASTYSFFPTKNLFCLGDGGLVAVTDPELGERVRLLRFHGSRDKQIFDLVGTNSRLDEVQAAALRIFLPRARRLERRSGARRPRATPSSGLGELVELPPDEPGHVYHMFCVRTPERDRAARGLRRAGDRARGLLHDSAPPPARLPAPRLGGGLAARDGAGRRREHLPAAVGGDRRGRQRRVVDAVRAALPAAVR